MQIMKKKNNTKKSNQITKSSKKVKEIKKKGQKPYRFIKKNRALRGINKALLKQVYRKIGINLRSRKKKLTLNYKTVKAKRKQLKMFVKGRKLYKQNKKVHSFLQDMKCYRGLRTKYKYPCRGQRTKTNAKTKKKFKL